jgi:hypothetical protein
MNSPADQALLACIRALKGGSKSFSSIVAEAFPDCRSFYLPDTRRREA